jgi:hypothetical protein
VADGRSGTVVGYRPPTHDHPDLPSATLPRPDRVRPAGIGCGSLPAHACPSRRIGDRLAVHIGRRCRDRGGASVLTGAAFGVRGGLSDHARSLVEHAAAGTVFAGLVVEKRPSKSERFATEDEAVAWIDAMKTLAMVVRVMEQALRDGLIERNPARITGWQRDYARAEDELDDSRSLALPNWHVLTTLADALVAKSADNHRGWGDEPGRVVRRRPPGRGGRGSRPVRGWPQHRLTWT